MGRCAVAQGNGLYPVHADHIFGLNFLLRRNLLDVAVSGEVTDLLAFVSGRIDSFAQLVQNISSVATVTGTVPIGTICQILVPIWPLL